MRAVVQPDDGAKTKSNMGIDTRCGRKVALEADWYGDQGDSRCTWGHKVSQNSAGSGQAIGEKFRAGGKACVWRYFVVVIDARAKAATGC